MKSTPDYMYLTSVVARGIHSHSFHNSKTNKKTLLNFGNVTVGTNHNKVQDT